MTKNEKQTLIVEIMQEERIYTDQNEALVAVHLRPILLTNEEHKALLKNTKEHLLNLTVS